MAMLFTDELSKPRQQLYWELLRDYCTIEEWEYAVAQAMRHETFYKIPLPFVLMEYVREYRQMRRGVPLRDELPDGTHTPEELVRLRADPIASEEVRHLIQSVWPELEA